jgi:signal transduction histidine kinase/ActR/RegA family two-component response regulator
MFKRASHSVHFRLLMVVIITTSAALALAAAALIVYDVRTYEHSRLTDLSTLADVLGAASGPALAFQDPREAQSNLDLLRVRPMILAGALYEVNGNLFAIYSPDNLGPVPLPPPELESSRVDGGRLTLFKPVLEKGERVGTLYLVAKYEVAQRLVYSAVIICGVVLVAMLLSIPVSAWLGRTITNPIGDVTAAARRVMEHRDYSIRVEKTTQDEIGYLVDTFNAMLDEVGRRSAALEEADRRKDEFLAVLSHELRNPLNPIVNAIAVLRLARSNPAQVQWAAEVIDRQARHLARLLDDLMDVARITRNKIELRLQDAAVKTIVDMAAEATRASFEANGQSLELDVPADPIFLRADPARLAQVIGNLLSNAAKYTDRGGNVRLSVARQGRSITLSVKDSGVGIAREDLSRLFEMFTQLRGSGGRTGGGLGIGLALVRALVEMHGGHVEARSEGLGRGSEFIVTLPLGGAPVPTPDAHQEPAHPGAMAPLKILVADDVIDSRQSLGMGLGLLGHEVRTAGDGIEALDVAAAFRPQVAILDIGMPGLDGYELAQKIRKEPWGRDMLLVALTGWGQSQDIERSAAAGFDHHMTKPADFDVLARLIDNWVAERSPASTA